MEFVFLVVLLVSSCTWAWRQPSPALRMFSGSQLRRIQHIVTPQSRLYMSDNDAGDQQDRNNKDKENEEWLDPAFNSLGSRGRSLKRANSDSSKGIENLSIEELVEQAAREQREQAGNTLIATLTLTHI